MKKKVYWKDIGLSLTSSKGRFLSIFSLMLLGSLALTGLKVTSPNMERTAQSYLASHRTMDLAVISDLGLSQEDLAELEAIEGASVEAGFFKDVTVAQAADAIRLFSKLDRISSYSLLEGSLPSSNQEIALSPSLNSSYKIGDSIEIKEPDKNGHVLTNHRFTVVGFVASAEIWDNVTMGIANSGDGQLAGYGVVDDTAFDSEVYMIARLRYQDLENSPYYSQDYQDKLEQHQQELEQLLADNDENRLASIKADGQAEIAQGEAEISKAQEQISQAEQAIQSGRAALETGQTEFARGRAKIVQSEMELYAAFTQLLESKAKLESTKVELDKRKQQLDQTAAFLETTYTDLTQAAGQLEQAQQELDRQNASLSQLAADISDGRFRWHQGQQELNSQIKAQLQPGQSLSDYPALLARQEELDAEKGRLDQLQTIYDQNQATYLKAYELYQTEQANYQANLDKYHEWNTQYQAGLAQYQAGHAQYEQAVISYEKGVAEYEAGLAQLDSTNLTLNQEQLRLNQADYQLEQAKDELLEKQAQANQEIAQAQTELAEAKDELNSLKKSSYQIYNRSTLPGGDGYATYNNASKSIAAVGNIFPLVLYLVAALVTFTTMARFVDEERTRIGLFKALGYTNHHILTKFVLYGLAAGLTGTLVGIVLGNTVLSPIISSIITKTTILGQTRLYVYPLWTGLAILFSLLSTVLPAYLVAGRELFEKPARLLLPKPPAAGSSILLEKWRFVWSRLSFTHKVTARNIFRYKLRMLMTIFGVAGTIALLFGGLGIRSSISGVVERQFGELIHYDMLIVENGRASDQDLDKLTAFLQSSQIRQSLPVAFEQLREKVEHDGQQKQLSISLFISDQTDLGHLISLESQTGQPLKLSDRGIILTEKLAQIYGVSAGDRLELTIEEQKVTVRVVGVIDMYAGHFIYMTANYYEEVTGIHKLANAYLVELNQGQAEQVQQVSSQLLDMPAVKSLVQNTSLMTMLTTIAASLQTIMLILVGLSILLGLVILYNLTIINMSERIRELSTIRVLGFHNKEVTLYIYRETIALSLIGIVVGLVGGYYLHKLLLAMIGSDSIRFNPQVGPEVYLIPILAIVGILGCLGWYVNHLLRKVDMLEALKSID